MKKILICTVQLALQSQQGCISKLWLPLWFGEKKRSHTQKSPPLPAPQTEILSPRDLAGNTEELSLSSKKNWNFNRFHLAYANQRDTKILPLAIRNHTKAENQIRCLDSFISMWPTIKVDTNKTNHKIHIHHILSNSMQQHQNLINCKVFSKKTLNVCKIPWNILKAIKHTITKRKSMLHV